MDLVNIRKKAQQEKEKERRSEGSTPEQKTEGEVISRHQGEVKPEPERISESEVTLTQGGSAEPAIAEMPKTGKIGIEPPVEEEAEIEVISFQLGGEIYGVRIECVREVLKPLQITPVPRAPDYLKGVTSLRGEIIPVFDLKKRLALEGDQEGKRGRILILSVRNEVMGALIDEVKGVIKLNRKSIEPPPAIIAGVEADFLEGVTRIENQFISLLNVEEVMRI